MENNQPLAGARFEIERAPRGGYRVLFIDADDQLVLRSGPFPSSAQASAAIAVFKRRMKPSSVYRLRARGGSGVYFTVTGPAHALLATSSVFMNSAGMEKAIADAARDMPNAPVFNSGGAA